MSAEKQKLPGNDIHETRESLTRQLGSLRHRARQEGQVAVSLAQADLATTLSQLKEEQKLVVKTDPSPEHIQGNSDSLKEEHALSQYTTTSRNETIEIPATNIVDEVYENLKQQETAEPDPQEKIYISPLNEKNPEFFILLQHGVDKHALENGRVTRRELLQAGFVFLNRIGGGEKPIFDITIHGINFSSLRLLTQDQLQIIQDYQQGKPHLYSTHGEHIDAIRKDMLSLLLTTTSEAKRKKLALHIDDVSKAVNMDDNKKMPYEHIRGSKADWRNVWAYFLDLGKKHPGLIKFQLDDLFIQEECADIFQYDNTISNRDPRITVRGKLTTIIDSRTEGLNGLPSPFLDSGFHFTDINPDMEVITDHGTKRLNMVVLHLLSRGISEMGEGQGFDQQYPTVGEYIDEFYPQDPQDRIQIQATEEKRIAELEGVTRGKKLADIRRQIQERAIERANTWAKSSDAPLPLRAKNFLRDLIKR